MKKLLAILLSGLLLAVCLPMGAFTVSAAATSGTTGDCTWALDGTYLTISGEGEMGHYSSKYIDGVWRTAAPWGWEITSVAIEDGVTAIGIYAFCGCDSLESVSIPDSVTTIEDSAFEYCHSLSDVYYAGAKQQCADIFIGRDNHSLLNATWHYAKTNISGTTGDCTWVWDDTDHLTISGNGAMGDYSIYSSSSTPWGKSITSVTIEDGVTSVGNSAFYRCDSLATVTIPDSVTSIGEYAFASCTDLTSITLSANVTSIGDSAFNSCTSLTSITVSTANPHYSSMGGVLFNKEQTSLIQCPSGKSGEYIIPSTVTSVENSAFSFCNALISVTIPDGVTSIGRFGFSNCTSLESVTIPDSVTSIGDNVFYRCYSLTDVYYAGNEEQKAAISIGDYNDPLTNATWHYNHVPACDHVYDDDADPDCNACGVLRWAVCPDTDVTIRNEDGTVLPAGTTVTVSAVKIDESDVNLDEKTALVQVYDISLLLNGLMVQPDGAVAVTLPAPADAARYTDLQVVYIDDAGNVTPCETVVNEDGSLTFTTDHFSYYAIVGTPAITYGDANGDGAVNNRDVALLQQYINHWDVTLDVTAADANGDGAVNNRDVALLQQYINHWDVTLG